VIVRDRAPVRATAGIVTQLLGSAPVWQTARAGLTTPLRVLAYHDVPDPDAFERQLRHVARRYDVVSGETVVGWLRGDTSLPRHALWITFDDGCPSAVDAGLPALDALALPATLFVCPGLVDGEPFWWDVVARAEALGWRPDDHDAGGAALVSRLKQAPDAVRRSVVAAARHTLDAAGIEPSGSVDHAALTRWVASGRELGNHTWDHPCLDRCDDDEQARQIRDAGAWLDAFGAFARVRLFAYPNGDWTPAAEALLRKDGYDAALLFDHRPVGRTPNALRLSRLRLDSDAPLPRARAVVSGAHSLALHATKRGQP
jgi:peptidoglycan/xylan/chitin deacetylase (PgdA/CDA1 family)